MSIQHIQVKMDNQNFYACDWGRKGRIPEDVPLDIEALMEGNCLICSRTAQEIETAQEIGRLQDSHSALAKQLHHLVRPRR